MNTLLKGIGFGILCGLGAGSLVLLAAWAATPGERILHELLVFAGVITCGSVVGATLGGVLAEITKRGQ